MATYRATVPCVIAEVLDGLRRTHRRSVWPPPARSYTRTHEADQEERDPNT